MDADEASAVLLGVLAERGLVAEAKHDLIFYSNRSTPKVVSKGAPAPENPPSGWGKYQHRRAANSDEEKKIKNGDWLRVDHKGNKPGSGGYKKSGYRDWLPKGGSKS